MRPLSPSQKLRLANERSSAQRGKSGDLRVVQHGTLSRPARSRISKADEKTFSGEMPSANRKHPVTNEKPKSKKEMQSINEELTALNGQQKETIERQRATSNDLQNVLFSTNVATIFLDVDLNICFFTPATRLLFNVRPIDIGRPLADMTCLAVDETLLTDAKKVLHVLEPIEREIEARSGAWYIRRILPYRTQVGGIEGVVITFADITHRKEAADALSEARTEADAANAAK
jgi:two-component system CheB/CheR fusion protein